VKKGQILALINTDQLVAQLQQAQATLAQAQATLAQSQLTHDRYTELEKHSAISREQLNVSTGDFARAKAGVGLAQATVDQDKTQLGWATIYAPIDGVVLDRKVSAGQTVAASFTTPVLFTLASNLDDMELDVDIDEEENEDTYGFQSAEIFYDTLEELTPQELQITLLLTSGKTTRETAAALFLSPKTVEYHLRHVYQKLGIHSREELAQALAAQDPRRAARPAPRLPGRSLVPAARPPLPAHSGLAVPAAARFARARSGTRPDVSAPDQWRDSCRQRRPA